VNGRALDCDACTPITLAQAAGRRRRSVSWIGAARDRVLPGALFRLL